MKVDQRGVVLDVLLKPSVREKACYSIKVPMSEKEGDFGRRDLTQFSCITSSI